MKLRIPFVLLTVLIAVSLVAVAWSERDEDEQEQKIALADAPKAVQEAIQRLANGREIDELEKLTDDGISMYEVEFEGKGGDESFKLAESGEVIANGVEIEAGDLPGTVRDVIAKKFPGAEIVEAEKVTVTYYEVAVRKEGLGREFVILASGKMPHDDDEDADDDDDDDDDDDKDDDDD